MSIDARALKTDEFETITAKYMDSIYSFILYTLGDEYYAQNLIQNIYIMAYKRFDDLGDNINYKSWLFKISTDVLMNFISYNNVPAYTSISEENGLFEAMHSLPIQHRIAIILADVEEFSYIEISYIIGHPVKKVVSMLHKGRKVLKEKMYN